MIEERKQIGEIIRGILKKPMLVMMSLFVFLVIILIVIRSGAIGLA